MPQLQIDDDPLTVIERDFDGMYSGELGLSSISGGQTASDAALATLDISGYAAKRSDVLPRQSRGASVLYPCIRHNILTLAAVWNRVREAPSRDREKYHDELLWQEYARHL